MLKRQKKVYCIEIQYDMTCANLDIFLFKLYENDYELNSKFIFQS